MSRRFDEACFSSPGRRSDVGVQSDRETVVRVLNQASRPKLYVSCVINAITAWRKASTLRRL
jgi:hypothetical protein